MRPHSDEVDRRGRTPRPVQEQVADFAAERAGSSSATTVPRALQDVVRLQRQAGNRSVSRMLVQRFSVTNNYVMGAAAPAPAGAAPPAAFISQGQRRNAAGALERFRETRQQGAAAGTVDVSEQIYQAPAAGGGAAPWAVGPSALVAAGAAQPPVRLSQTGLFAVEQTAQARVFYIDPGAVAGFNASLAGVNSRYRIRLDPGGAQLTFPAGAGHAGPFTLDQASIGTAAGAAVTATAHHHCDAVAKALVGNFGGNAVPGGAVDAAALPAVGQVFHIQSLLRGNENDVIKLSDLQASIQRIQNLINNVAGVHLTAAEETLKGGWMEHFEGVIASDGSDRLTLANYNRAVEVDRERFAQFQQLYLANLAFRAAANADLKAMKDRLYSPELKTWGGWWKHGGESITPATLGAYLRTGGFEATLNAMGGGMVAIANALTQFTQASSDHVAIELFYFDMYGTAAAGQSFHERYEPGMRGRTATTAATT